MGVDTRQALPLHDETRRRGRVTRANLKDATVHQDPKRWAFGRRYAASPSSVCVMRLLPTVRIQPYTRVLNVGLVDVVHKRVPDFCFFLRDETCANCRDADCTPGSQALGLWASFDGEPFLCLNSETYLHRTGACGTMLHHLPTRASHLMYCAGTALVGPCCTICAREHATYTAARVCGSMLRRRSKPHYRSAYHYIHPGNVPSWEVAPCCCSRCCCCRCFCVV